MRTEAIYVHRTTYPELGVDTLSRLRRASPTSRRTTLGWPTWQRILAASHAVGSVHWPRFTLPGVALRWLATTRNQPQRTEGWSRRPFRGAPGLAQTSRALVDVGFDSVGGLLRIFVLPHA